MSTGRTAAPRGGNTPNQRAAGPRPTMDDRLAGRSGPAGTELPALRALPAGRRRLPGPAVGQLVAVEVAAFAIAAVVGRGLLLPIVVAFAVLVTLLLLGRWRGRWWYQQIPLRLRYRRARRGARGGVDPRRGALRELAPRLSAADVTERDATYGLGYDGAGWFAVIEVRDAAVPLSALAELLDDRLTRLTVSYRYRVAPTPRLTAWAPAAMSYQDGSAKLAGRVPPGDAATHLCLRLDTRDAVTAADSRGGGTAGVSRALAAALRRAERVLSAAGAAHRTLRADELLAALTTSVGLAPVALPGRRIAPGWDRCDVDGYRQVSYQVTGWPPRAGRLDALLATGPTAWTTLTLVLGPRTGTTDDAELPLRGYLRVAAPPDAFGAATESLAKAAALHGVTLRRLDGEQHTALYATAPTGTEPPGTAVHAAPVAALDRLAPAVPAGGLLLGRDPDRKPVLVPLFGDRPRRVLLIGSIWPTRLVLLRCLAVGARARASAGTPDWVSLGRWATGADHWVLPAGAPVPAAHPAAPVLVAVDPTGPAAPPPMPWQTVAATATRPSAALLSGADLVLTGKLLPADARLIGTAFGLPDEQLGLLSRMYDDMVAIVEPGAVRFCWPTPTTVETEILTPPRRHQPALGAPPR